MKYPEHEKLEAVQNQSQQIGEFLDMGLPKLGLMLYEERYFDCECQYCENGEGTLSNHRFLEKEKGRLDEKRGVALYPRMSPTFKTIRQILAEHFGIDQAKIDAEKDQMLKEMHEKAEAG